MRRRGGTLLRAGDTAAGDQGAGDDRQAPAAADMDVTLRLPDELLLEVFTYLDPEALLRLRAVCRRWRHLAVDRHAWKEKKFSVIAWHTWDVSLLNAILRSAPCLHKLTFEVSDKKLLPRLNVLYRTSCSISRLKIDFCFEEKYMDLLSKILEHQRFLGGLQYVSVRVRPKYNSRKYQQMVKTLCNLGCNELTIWDDSYFIDENYLERDVSPASSTSSSLRYLFYHGSSWGSTLRPLLAAHSSTLQILRIPSNVFTHQTPSSIPIDVLSELKCLEEIRCPVFPKIDNALLQCPILSDISLDGLVDTGEEELGGITAAGEEGMKAAELLLRHSVTLKQLGLFVPNSSRSPAKALELLETVASSSNSRIETLTLDFHYNLLNEIVLDRLRGCLPGLPSLRELWVTSHDLPQTLTPGFLRSLTPDAAPSLRLLPIEVTIGCPRTQEGEQVWYLPGLTVREYLEELRALTQRLPELHVTGIKFAFSCKCVGGSRGARECLTDVLEMLGISSSCIHSERTEFGVHSHEESKECIDYAFRTNCSKWIRFV